MLTVSTTNQYKRSTGFDWQPASLSNDSEIYRYSWLGLVFEKEAGQNSEWMVFDVSQTVLSGNAIGYAYVSTRGQSLSSQIDALISVDAVRVFKEHASGATQARSQWREYVDYLQHGYVLLVSDLTQLGRSTADLAEIMTILRRRGNGFRSLTEPWLDTTSADGKLIFDMLASLVEYERSRLSERTKAGLESGKARGLQGGRPRSITPAKTDAARQLGSQGKTLACIAQSLSVSISSVKGALNPDRDSAGATSSPCESM